MIRNRCPCPLFNNNLSFLFLFLRPSSLLSRPFCSRPSSLILCLLVPPRFNPFYIRSALTETKYQSGCEKTTLNGFVYFHFSLCLSLRFKRAVGPNGDKDKVIVIRNKFSPLTPPRIHAFSSNLLIMAVSMARISSQIFSLCVNVSDVM